MKSVVLLLPLIISCQEYETVNAPEPHYSYEERLQQVELFHALAVKELKEADKQLNQVHQEKPPISFTQEFIKKRIAPETKQVEPKPDLDYVNVATIIFHRADEEDALMRQLDIEKRWMPPWFTLIPKVDLSKREIKIDEMILFSNP